MLKKTKDWLFYYFAKKNWGVCREYCPYVDRHREEHITKPWRHWWLLIRLNWHYRILRKTTYLIPEVEQFSNPELQFEALHYPECEISNRWSVERLVNKLMEYDVVSFDIFDTLIFRPFTKPIDAFYLLEATNGLIDFAVNRRMAEAKAREKTSKPNMELDIFEIYEELANYYDIDAYEMAIQEIELERKICYANPYMHKVYSKLQENDVKIIATSDMYIPSRYLQSLLDACGYEGLEKIYVSCEYGQAKSSGNLQKAVQSELGKNVKVIHVDDMLHCIEGAKKAGWATYHYRSCNELGGRYRYHDLNMPVSLMSKGIINNYLHCGYYKMTPMQEFGFSYAGLAVCGYCEWIADYCKSHSCDRILFLARDANIFWKVYTEFYNDIPSSYIQSSRNALQELVFHHYTFEFISHMIDVRVGLDQTIAVVLNAANLSMLEPYLASYGIRPNTVLDHGTRNALVKLILDYKQEITDYFNRGDTVAKEYFADAINNAKKICIVGLGWAGSEIIYLKYLFEQKWKFDIEVTGTLFGAQNRERASNIVSTQTITPFVFSDALNRYLTLDRSGNAEEAMRIAIECCFSSSERSLLRYDVDNKGKVFFTRVEENPNEYFVEEFQQGVLQYAKELMRHRGQFRKWLPITGVDAYEPMYRSMGNPSFMVATLGNMQEKVRALSGADSENVYVSLYDMLKNYNLLTKRDEQLYEEQRYRTQQWKAIIDAVGEKHDDIYIFKHHIGEIYLYLNLVKKYVKTNKSQKPVLLVNEERYIPLYKMFVPDMDMAYYPLSSENLDRLFPNDTVEYRNHRFFSPIPDRFEELRALITESNSNTHFYPYIRDVLNIPARENIEFSVPIISQATKISVKKKAKSIRLNLSKFIVLSPEAVTASPLRMSFWKDLVKSFRGQDYDVFLNCVGDQYISLDAKRCHMTLDEIYYLTELSQGLVALVSGLVVCFAQIDVPRYIIYTDQTPTVGERMTADIMLDAYKMESIPNCKTDTLYEISMNDVNEEQLLQRIKKAYEID